ncbi:cupin domain-containing protein [Solirubrobacter ginsenosidimutans]
MAFADPDDPSLTHLAVVGDTYTILLSGEDTDGRYALIDMLIPAGGGPPPHRHAFEEMFHVLEGAVEVTVRDVTSTARAGETVNIPANAPHAFRNPTERTIRMLCMVSPAGLERYFAEFGDRVATRTSAPPELSERERAERMQRAVASAEHYGMEILL